MNFYDTVFLMSFVAALAILFYKIYSCIRLTTDGPAYKFPGAVLTFVGYFLAWVVCLVVMLHDPGETLYSTLLYLLNWCILLNVLMFLIEVFLTLRFASTGPIKAYGSGERRTTPYFPGAGK